LPAGTNARLGAGGGGAVQRRDYCISEYLSVALEDPDPDILLMAVRNVARAKGMSQLAKDSGLGRESLYKALTPGAKPRYETVLKLISALGVKLHAVPAH